MKQGFSLVELSIVLVILGLLTGGILTGQNLIRAAELRSVATEYQKNTTAIHAFRDKYFALPGDMNNATNFWGAAHATPATCLTTVGTGTQTCNGNGDGNISISAAASQRGETFAAWVHLANAGLIEGTYSGFAGSAAALHTVLGTNAPVSKLSNGGWSCYTEVARAIGQVEYFENHDGETNIASFYFGAQTTNTVPRAAVLRAEEAWNIDVKMDDGHPAYGKIYAPKSTSTFAPNCTTGATASVGVYNLTNTSAACSLRFYKPY